MNVDNLSKITGRASLNARVRTDGPAMTVVYYVTDGDEILISTMAERAKAQAVQRNPNVSIYVLDAQ
ncbi:pyridoxamine 5'-phosphate oxidase family protein [Mycobacterium sp. 1482292.6]|uniref:pyridoxamine 5'-phosphate oxidase family protein n=1 Tax=Mycobacterium sp. 1482292.6 TaxID=1834081 RepID=UPI000A409FB4|nr:pyridoxamine 5'-phosphate oxidase family protein [Mycobacterium sp. 1482292.6]